MTLASYKTHPPPVSTLWGHAELRISKKNNLSNPNPIDANRGQVLRLRVENQLPARDRATSDIDMSKQWMVGA